MCNLFLPSHFVLAIDLSHRIEALALLEQDGADDDRIVTLDGLMMVWMSGAVRAVVAVGWLARVTSIGVGLQLVAALGEFKSRFGNNLIQGAGSAAEGLASITVAKNGIGLGFLQFNFPCCLATMALSGISCHVCC